MHLILVEAISIYIYIYIFHIYIFVYKRNFHLKIISLINYWLCLVLKLLKQSSISNNYFIYSLFLFYLSLHVTIPIFLYEQYKKWQKNQTKGDVFRCSPFLTWCKRHFEEILADFPDTGIDKCGHSPAAAEAFLRWTNLKTSEERKTLEK